MFDEKGYRDAVWGFLPQQYVKRGTAGKGCCVDNALSEKTYYVLEIYACR